MHSLSFRTDCPGWVADQLWNTDRPQHLGRFAQEASRLEVHPELVEKLMSCDLVPYGYEPCINV